LTLALVAGGVLPPAVGGAEDPGPRRPTTASSVEEIGQLGAQDVHEIGDISLDQLLKAREPDVEVATRRPTPLSEAPGSVSVLRGEEIRNLGLRSLLEAIALLPGVDITRDQLGRPRITLRGVPSGGTLGASETVLLIVDGHRLNEEVLGGAGSVNLDVPVDHVRQVELLRGPAAALYGSAALAGVINVVFEGPGDLKGTELTAAFGSFATQEYVLRSGGRTLRLGASGFIRFVDSHGPGVAIPADAQSVDDLGRIAAGRAPISLAPGPASDALRSLETAYRLNLDDFSFGIRSRRERTGPFVGYADSLGRQGEAANFQFAMDLRFAREVPRVGKLTLRASFVQSEVRQFLEVFPSGYEVVLPDGSRVMFGKPGGDGGVFLQTSLNMRRYGLEGTVAREIGSKHSVLAGLSLELDQTFDLSARANLDFGVGQPLPADASGNLAELPGGVAETRRSVIGLFVQDVFTLSPRHSLTGGLRLDHTWGVGATVSPRLALTGRLAAIERRLPASASAEIGYRLTYSRGYRAPSINELYFNLPGYSANPKLGYSTLDSFEGGLTLRRPRLRVDTGLSYGLYHGAIVSTTPFDPLERAPATNGPGARILAWEIETSAGFSDDETLFANYTYQHAVDRATEQPAAGIPAHLLNLGASFTFATRWSVSPSLRVRGSRPRAVGDTRDPTAGWAAFCLSARARRLWRTLEASFRIDDLFAGEGADPAPVWGVPGDYPRVGRRFTLSASYRF
jgi:outer membrane receptor for ferrienterochelin and colicins